MPDIILYTVTVLFEENKEYAVVTNILNAFKELDTFRHYITNLVLHTAMQGGFTVTTKNYEQAHAMFYAMQKHGKATLVASS